MNVCIVNPCMVVSKNVNKNNTQSNTANIHHRHAFTHAPTHANLNLYILSTTQTILYYTCYTGKMNYKNQLYKSIAHIIILTD